MRLNITNVGVRGQGVGKDPSGNVVFVPGALPGDEIEATLVSKQPSRYSDAHLERVLTPSKDRVKTDCPYFSKCGGCDWLHWEYSEQLKAKEAIVSRTLDRLGLVPIHRYPIVGSEKLLGFRTRVQLHSDGERLGFYEKRSHKIVDIEHCLVAHPKINEAISELRKHPPSSKKIELKLGTDGNVSQFEDVPNAPVGFTQNHAAQNEHLKEAVAAAVKVAKAETLLELFCGDGNLSFAAIPHAGSLYGFDGNAAAIEIARSGAVAGGFTKADFSRKTISARLATHVRKQLRLSYDTLLLDPPRKGMGGELDAFVWEGLKSIIYVSCSPPAFSKDVKHLAEKGFRLQSVQAIDMFPHTPHIEFVSLFSRS